MPDVATCETVTVMGKEQLTAIAYVDAGKVVYDADKAKECLDFVDGLSCTVSIFDIAAENFDFVCHYGDYSYEAGYRTTWPNGQPVARAMPRDFPTCVTLIDYRRRYTLYKSDPDLQAAHSNFAWLVTFDDHEVPPGDPAASSSAAANHLARACRRVAHKGHHSG